jgi:NADH:ubiquinone oxidoreductase subunit 4 (subunit M)
MANLRQACVTFLFYYPVFSSLFCLLAFLLNCLAFQSFDCAELSAYPMKDLRKRKYPLNVTTQQLIHIFLKETL